MNRFFISAAAIALLTAPVLAADLPMHMSGLNPQPLPPIAESTADEPIDAEEAMQAEAMQSGPAPDSRVRITNATDVEIVELYASEVGADNFNTDVLGGRRVAPGAGVTVNFANGSGVCEFDVRAVFGDGAVQTLEGLDACAVGEVNFTS